MAYSHGLAFSLERKARTMKRESISLGDRLAAAVISAIIMGLMAFVGLVVSTFGKRSFPIFVQMLRVYEAFPVWGSVVVLFAFAAGFVLGTKRVTELFGHLWYTAEPRRPGVTLSLWAVLFGVLLAVYFIFGFAL